jgi:protein TonB
MLISKFDLYKSEWLELVFEDRNKAYGAYYLRQHYAGNMLRAMGITFLSLFLLLGVYFLFRSKPVLTAHHDSLTVVTLSNPKIIKPNLVMPKKPVAPITHTKSLTPVKTQQFVPYVVKPDPDVVKSPPVNTQLNGNIGQATLNGTGDPGISLPDDNTGTAPKSAGDETIHTTSGLEVMPEPVGGASAWAKFLNKNLRFPAEAQDAQVSGRVILSFVIEKDGHLSNIVLEQPAGHGFDEEALRVLKLAKAWKPGMQNGQPVRVKYSIPINFQLAE